MQKRMFNEQWDGPFEVKEVMGKGTYKLTNLSNGKEVL